VVMVLGMNFTLFPFFSAGGGNGMQLIFSSDEFAFCTKTYACHFCFFLEFQYYINFESYFIAFLSIFLWLLKLCFIL